MTRPSATDLPCEGHDHYPLVMVNDIFNFSVDQMFDLVFDDSPVQRILSKRRHRSDVVWNPWILDADGTKRRDVTYVVTVPRQPKPFNFTEKQVLSSDSRPGHFYFVEAECVSLSVPYGDSFYVVDRCYISRIADDRSRLCITCDIVFLKKVWAPVKSVISDMVTDGITKYFHLLADILRKDDIDDDLSTDLSMPLEEPEYDAAEAEYFEDRSFFSTGVVYFLFACSIFCLVCVIGVLFHGLWASVDRMSFMSSRALHKQRMSHACNRRPVGTIADDLVAQLSELLASATRLIETTAENLEELTRREPKIENSQEEDEEGKQQEQHQDLQDRQQEL